MPKPRRKLAAPEPPTGHSVVFRLEQIHQRLSAVTPTGSYRVSVPMLARELEVARSTIKKDFELLRLFNAPLESDRARRTYYYTKPFKLRPPVWLKSDEQLALLVAIRMAARSRALPVGGSLVRAMGRIAPSLAGAASFVPDDLNEIISTSGANISEDEARCFVLLCDAINQRREVRLTYQKAKNGHAPETRVIHPLHWFIRPDACLLIVHEPAVHDRRNFELARIRSVEMTGATFTPPKGFDLKRHLKGAFGRFVGEPVHAVRVAFQRDYVPFVREQPWQPDQILIERPDGSAEATFHVCHTAELEQNILHAGGQAEVVEPPDVRERIRSAAKRILQQHQ